MRKIKENIIIRRPALVAKTVKIIQMLVEEEK